MHKITILFAVSLLTISISACTTHSDAGNVPSKTMESSIIKKNSILYEANEDRTGKKY